MLSEDGASRRDTGNFPVSAGQGKRDTFCVVVDLFDLGDCEVLGKEHGFGNGKSLEWFIALRVEEDWSPCGVVDEANAGDGGSEKDGAGCGASKS